MNILFATDGSTHAGEAAALLRLLPLSAGSRITAVHVVPPPDATFREGWRAYDLLETAQRERATSLLERAAVDLAHPGVIVTGRVMTGEPAAAILDAARQSEAELIVIGSRGLTGLKAFFLGSVARNVAQHAACPVLVARKPRHELARAILATDGSSHAAGALALACRLPLPAACVVTVVNVVRPYTPIPSMMPMEAVTLDEAMLEIREQQMSDAHRLVQGAAATLQAAGRQTAAVVATGDPAEELALLAEESETDLLIVGARGVSAIEALLLGSVADRLLARAHASVLIAR